MLLLQLMIKEVLSMMRYLSINVFMYLQNWGCYLNNNPKVGERHIFI